MQKNKQIIGLLLFSIFLLFGKTQAQNFDKTDWVLKTKEKNLKLYTRNSDESGVKEVRIRTQISTTLEKLLLVLGNVPNYQKWVYKCSESKMVKVDTNDDYHYYTRYDFPFPLSDRDIVVRSRQWLDKEGIFYSHATLVKNMVDLKKGIVRIKDFDAHWKIIQREDGVLDIDYVVQTHPGGSLPSWAINLGIAKGPIETMKRLIKEVEKM